MPTVKTALTQYKLSPALVWLLTNDPEACEPQVLKRTGLADCVQEGVQEERNMSCQKS